MRKSEFGKLDIYDILKGAFFTAVSSILTAVILILESADISVLFDIEKLKYVLIIGLTTFATYVLKRILTNSNDKFLKNETKTRC